MFVRVEILVVMSHSMLSTVTMSEQASALQIINQYIFEREVLVPISLKFIRFSSFVGKFKKLVDRRFRYAYPVEPKGV